MLKTYQFKLDVNDRYFTRQERQPMTSLVNELSLCGAQRGTAPPPMSSNLTNSVVCEMTPQDDFFNYGFILLVFITYFVAVVHRSRIIGVFHWSLVANY